MINSASVENFEPFGKAFYSQHPFAAIPCEIQDGSHSKLADLILFYFDLQFPVFLVYTSLD